MRSDGDPGRHRPNGAPYKPWHDATMAMSGDAAAMVAQLCRDRWERATGEQLDARPAGGPDWPDGLRPLMQSVAVTLARTRAPFNGETEVYEVEALSRQGLFRRLRKPRN